MPLIRRRSVLGCLLAAAPLRARATTEPAAPNGSNSGGNSNSGEPSPGQLLVATPDMNDPRFVGAVLLMLQHDGGGAMGLAINKPIGEKSLTDLLGAIGEAPGDVQGSLTVFDGGPVEPTSGFIVHSSDYHLPETIRLDAHVSISPPRPVLHDLGRGRGPAKRLLVVGYAGWEPGQLEAELTLHVWLTVTETPALVFDMDRSKVWGAALARQTIPL